MSVNMTIIGVSGAVQTLLNGLSDPDFVNVIPAPESEDSKFTGYPSARHFYQGTEPSYATVTQNRRVIEHSVFIYLLYVGKTEEEKWANATDKLDKVIQAFDESVDLNGACDIMRPTPGRLSKVSVANGEALVAELTLYCEADLTFRDA